MLEATQNEKRLGCLGYWANVSGYITTSKIIYKQSTEEWQNKRSNSSAIADSTLKTE